MDMFAIHPYLIPSRLPPSFAHPNSTTIGIADYLKLVALLTRAFAHTAQDGATLPIIYDEFGYQSRVPARKRSLYVNFASPAARDDITEPRQALYYRQSIALAACHTNVAGILIFHVIDERDAKAWQSGVYHPDGTPKTSMDGVRLGALAARDGTSAAGAAPKTASSLDRVIFHQPPAAGPLQVDLTCSRACVYDARLLDLRSGEATARIDGAGRGAQTISIRPRASRPGATSTSWTFTAGKPGTAVRRTSRPFSFEPPQPPESSDPPPEAESAPVALPPIVPLLPLLSDLPTLVPLAS